MEVLTETEFKHKINQSVLLTDMIGEDNCVKLGLSQSQIVGRYAVQLELWSEQ